MRPLSARPYPLPACAGTGFAVDPPTHLHAAQTDKATRPRLHYPYQYLIFSRISELEMLPTLKKTLLSLAVFW